MFSFFFIFDFAGAWDWEKNIYIFIEFVQIY